MTLYTKALVSACALSVIIASHWAAYEHGRSVERGVEAGKAVTAWAKRWTLQSQLATRDVQLAQAQAEAGQVRTVEVIKREVIYRDRIKTPSVADCVRDSGLLQFYDATLGLSDPAE